jgi:GPI-anchor transamidase subunit GAA1
MMAAPIFTPMSTETYYLTKSLSMLILGLFLSALATLNFSLSFVLGLLCMPILFANRDRGALGYLNWALLLVMSPMGLWAIACVFFTLWLGDTSWAAKNLARVAFGWNVLGSWGIGIGVCVIWLPAWMTAAILSLTGGRMVRRKDAEGESTESYKDEVGGLAEMDEIGPSE